MANYNQSGEVLYLTFQMLEQFPFIRHAFSTRKGGVSTSIYESMNLGFHRGDEKENVEQNFSLLCDAVGIDTNSLVFGAQTHSVNVRRVGKEDRGFGILQSALWHDVDGLMTDESDVFLTTYYADCVPLYFVDPIHRAVALSHAGWRGTVANMAATTVEQMSKEFGTNPQDLFAVIGPSIGPCCFEVGQEVAERFIELGDLFASVCVTKKMNSENFPVPKYFVDLQKSNKIMMEQAGVLPEQIEVANICTSCNADWLFSHRATGGKRGSLCAILGIVTGSHSTTSDI